MCHFYSHNLLGSRCILCLRISIKCSPLVNLLRVQTGRNCNNWQRNKNLQQLKTLTMTIELFSIVDLGRTDARQMSQIFRNVAKFQTSFSRKYFCILVFLHTRDSNSDILSRKWAKWPLNNHLGLWASFHRMNLFRCCHRTWSRTYKYFSVNLRYANFLTFRLVENF